MRRTIDAFRVDPSVERTTISNAFPPPDMHCPELPQEGNNFWRASCLAKQTEEQGACKRKDCPTGLAVSGRTLGKKCKCGKSSISDRRLGLGKHTEPICDQCNKHAMKERRKERDQRYKAKKREQARQRCEAERRQVLQNMASSLRGQLAEVESQLGVFPIGKN